MDPLLILIILSSVKHFIGCLTFPPEIFLDNTILTKGERLVLPGRPVLVSDDGVDKVVYGTVQYWRIAQKHRPCPGSSPFPPVLLFPVQPALLFAFRDVVTDLFHPGSFLWRV